MLVPTVVENTARGERACDICSRPLRDRIVFLGGVIDGDSANAKHTGRHPEQVAADMDRDDYMTAQQALDYGLIDEIVERRQH